MNEKVYREAADAEEAKVEIEVDGPDESPEEEPGAQHGEESSVDEGEDELAALGRSLVEKESLAAANHDKYLRTLADLENYKVRARKEREESKRHANDKLIGEMLGVLDNMERALEHSDNEDSFESLKDGVKHIHDNIISTLATYGLKPVEAVGIRFDPNIHEAINEEVCNASAPGTVIREFKKGYYLNDRLLRAAMVSVAKLPDDSDEDDEGE